MDSNEKKATYKQYINNLNCNDFLSKTNIIFVLLYSNFSSTAGVAPARSRRSARQSPLLQNKKANGYSNVTVLDNCTSPKKQKTGGRHEAHGDFFGTSLPALVVSKTPGSSFNVASQ